MDFATDERRDFAELLDGLSIDQWERPTLCERWRVRDVVAHVLSYDELDARGVVHRLIRGRFLLDRVNAVGVNDYAGRTPRELTDLMHACIRPRGLTAGFGGRIALLDGMIHQQDIRRPLDLDRSIPADRLRAALDFARIAPPVRGVVRSRGLRLIATDLDWVHGSGAEVRGRGEALLMALAARPSALMDLDGPGVARLARQIGATR